MNICRWLGLLLALSCSAALAEEAKTYTYIELLAGASQTLVREEDGRYTSRLPIRLLPTKPPSPELTLKVLDIQFREGRSSDVAKEFTVHLDSEDATHGAALSVETKSKSPKLRPGSYALHLSVAPAGRLTEAQTFVLTLQKPVPTLGLGSTIVVRQTLPFWNIEAAAQTIPGTLHLSEESGRADIFNLAMRALPEQGDATYASRGELALPAPLPLTIEAGSAPKWDIAPSNSFPIGTSKGKIELRTPDIAGVSSVNYEVRARRHPLWLVVLAVLGVVFGAYVRKYLQNRQDRAAALEEASLIMGALAAAERRLEDPDVRAQLAEIRKKVRDAESSGNNTRILDAAKAATEALQTLKKTFEDDRKVAAAEVEAVHDLLWARWKAPPAVQPLLDMARSSFQGAVAALTRNNLAEAKQVREAVVDKELVDAVNASLDWRADMQRYFAAVAANPPPMLGKAFESLKMIAAEFGTAALTLKHVAATDIAAARTELTVLNDAYHGAKTVAGQLPDSVRDFLRWAPKTLGSRAMPEPVYQRLEGLSLSVIRQVAVDIDNPEPGWPTLVQALQLLQEEWINAIRQHLQPVEPDKVAELIRAGDWEKAMRTAVAPAAQGAIARAVREVARRPDAAAGGSGRSLVRGAATVVGSAPLTGFRVEGTEPERVALREQRLRAALLQGAFVAAVFVAAVFLLYADAWVGTYKEFVTVFMLAFGTDMTASGVIQAAK